MDKMGYPRGLMRYDTQNGLEQHLSRAQEWLRVFRPRVWIYSAVMLLIVAAVMGSLLTRPPFRYDIVRDRGALGRWNEQGQLENVYRLQIMNVLERQQRYRIRVESEDAVLQGVQVAGGALEVTLGPIEARWVPVAVHLPEGAAPTQTGAHTLHFVVERVAQGEDAAHAQDLPLLDFQDAVVLELGERAADRLELEPEVAADLLAGHAQDQRARREAARLQPLGEVQQERGQPLFRAHAAQAAA
jgi:hypothetical protein